MNCQELLRSWNSSDNNVNCSCWNIRNPETRMLLPGVVNEIIIRFIDDTPTTVLQVNNHMCDKPWRVISEYIYFNKRTHSITIPIITSFTRILLSGEPICHVELMNPLSTLQKIKGNSFFHCTIFLYKKI